MAGKPKDHLNPTQLKALALFDEGGLSVKEVAKACKFTPDYLYHLITGDISYCGQTADLFKKSYQEIQNKRDVSIENSAKQATQLVNDLLVREMKTLTSQKRLSLDEKKLLATIKNSIAKATTSVNIKNISYTYIEGLGPEELMHEYQRLTSVAESSFNRRPIQTASDAGSEGLSDGSEPGS